MGDDLAQEIVEVKALIAKDTDRVLDAKLRGLHQRKLMPMCLLNPKNRDKVDQLVSFIIEEKERRCKAQKELKTNAT